VCRCIPHLQASAPSLSLIFLDLSHSGGRWFMRFIRFFSRRVFSFVLPDSVLAPQWSVGLCRERRGLVICFRLRSVRSAPLTPGVPGIASTGQDIRLLCQLTTKQKILCGDVITEQIFLWPSLLRELSMGLTHLRKDLLFMPSNHRVWIIRFSVHCCREMPL
jgi:hypothetical protein